MTDDTTGGPRVHALLADGTAPPSAARPRRPPHLRKSEREIAISMTRQVDGVVAVADKLTFRLDDSHVQPDELAPHGVADDWLRRI
jgi:hypothetical protein